MAIDATGTPTTHFGIPTFDPANDAPSGLGSNAMMGAIDDALFTRAPKPSQATGIGEALGWDGSAFTKVSASIWSGSIPTTTTNQALGWNGTAFTAVSTLDPTTSSELAYVTHGLVNVTATTAAGANTIVTAASFTADGTSSYWVEYYCGSVLTDTNGRDAHLNLWEGAVDGGTFAQVFSNVSGGGVTIKVPIYARRKVTPAAGSRTYSVRGYQTGGAGTTVFDGTVGPGYIRIYKA